jgi:ubiquinone/menaquinone biosynthesis C-methylase UbiE
MNSNNEQPEVKSTPTYGFYKALKGAISFEIEDLFLLESFQIAYFPGWVPERELAAVLHSQPLLKNFFMKKCPSISGYVERVLAEYGPVNGKQELADCSDRLVWTINDLLIYNKCPEVYDSMEFHKWDFREITGITTLDGKVVVDGGAGTGRVALEAAQTARWLFAVEPVTRLRQFIREKAVRLNLSNVYTVDGFLHAIPLPDQFVDVLITSHALGWRLDDELKELERVVKKGGFIIHCPGTDFSEREEAQHNQLISPAHRYQFSKYREADGWKRKYWKQL